LVIEAFAVRAYEGIRDFIRVIDIEDHY